jgi:hypothetical protein
VTLSWSIWRWIPSSLHPTRHFSQQWWLWLPTGLCLYQICDDESQVADIQPGNSTNNKLDSKDEDDEDLELREKQFWIKNRKDSYCVHVYCTDEALKKW